MDNYIVSARKYRPATFDTVVGQRALTTTLKHAIASHKLAHAYLFCGPRGVGKTTCARIFAKTINCLHPTPDGEACNECESCVAFNEQRSFNIHELDAASNNSVEDIRSLIEQVRIPPQIGKYKVYIIDEVHMLSQAAFNAFLKTLEEPPAHAIFILATTEKHKILPTILSRCQIYDFSRISVNDIVEHLEGVARKEGIQAEAEALNVIAQKADGGMRDALSIFDQVTSFTGGHITYQSVIENLNVLDYEYYFRLTDAFLAGNVPQSLLIFDDVLRKGFDGNHFITGLGSHFRDLLVSHDAATLPLLEVGASIRERYREQAQKCSPQFLYRAIKMSNECDLNYRVSKNKRLLVESTLIQLCQLSGDAADDAPGSGLGPAQITFKPLFNRQQPATAAPAAQQTTAVSPQSPIAPAPSAVAPPPQDTPAVHASPLPRESATSAIPTLKAGSLDISIRKAQTRPTAPREEPTQTPVAATPPPSAKADKPVDDEELFFYWRDFAVHLPKEQTANSARMMNMRPALLPDGTTFEIVVDNEIVMTYMQELKPRILNYLRHEMGNSRIDMSIRVNTNPVARAYSQRERFQLMCQKNPALLKLQQVFGLQFR